MEKQGKMFWFSGALENSNGITTVPTKEGTRGRSPCRWAPDSWVESLPLSFTLNKNFFIFSIKCLSSFRATSNCMYSQGWSHPPTSYPKGLLVSREQDSRVWHIGFMGVRRFPLLEQPLFLTGASAVVQEQGQQPKTSLKALRAPSITITHLSYKWQETQHILQTQKQSRIKHRYS